MNIVDENFTGEYIEENENGKAVVNFINGKKEGITRFFNNNGDLLTEIEYKNDQICGKVKQYYDNGALLSVIEYIDNIPNGKIITYYESGIKQFEACYKNGVFHGIAISYDSFGDKIIEHTYKNGIKEGLYTIYYPKSNGNGICEQYLYENNVITGDRKTYYPTGELLSITPYKNGRPQKYTKMFNQKGNEVIS